MKKLFLITVIGIVTISLFGCTKNDNNASDVKNDVTATQTTEGNTPSKEKKTDIDISALGNKISELISEDEPLTVEKDAIADELYADVNDIADCYGAITFTGAFPGKIIIIKATDSDALARINEKLNEKLQDVLVQSKDYDEENYALAQTCKVVTEGNYTALFIHAKHDKMETLFKESFN